MIATSAAGKGEEVHTLGGLVLGPAAALIAALLNRMVRSSSP